MDIAEVEKMELLIFRRDRDCLSFIFITYSLRVKKITTCFETNILKFELSSIGINITPTYINFFVSLFR